MYGAALYGQQEAVQLLLQAAPAAATISNADGWLPTHAAASRGLASVLRVLLPGAPATAAAATDEGGWTPLALAARDGQVEAMQVLLAAAPKTAVLGTPDGLPLHIAANRGRLEAVQLLLQAAPEAAVARNERRRVPLHDAAELGHADVVQALLAAAPEAAAARDIDNWTPLAAVLFWDLQVDAARCLLSAGHAAEVLGTLSGAMAQWKREALLPLFTDCVDAHAPLSDAEWAFVPRPCPGLGAVLPAVLEGSTAQAARLVAHLPAEDAQRLRSAALCLAGAQRRRHVSLPQLVWHVLSLCLTP